jgi:hypothetical protein
MCLSSCEKVKILSKNNQLYYNTSRQKNLCIVLQYKYVIIVSVIILREIAMAARSAGKVGGALSRSEVVTVRLDPKLRYLAELAARKQRRTVSSLIEWAVENGLDSVRLSTADDGPTIWKEADSLWDVDEADRFVKLALRYPELLTHEEQILWKLIRDFGFVWRGTYNRDDEWQWTPDERSVLIERIRTHWDTFKAISGGDAEAKTKLPTWPSKRPANQKPSKKGGFDEMDEDIPF